MKKYILLLLPLIFVITALPVCAADVPRLVDNAGLLTESNAEEISLMLDMVSEERACDIVVVTTDSLDGKSVVEYADDYFDYNGYGWGDDYTGILFLVSMGEREWAFSTCGGAIDVFSDYRLMQMEEAIIPYLSDGDYYGAFVKFYLMCDDYLLQGVDSGSEYYYDDYYDDDYYYYDEYYNEYYGNNATDTWNYTGIAAVGSLAIGFVIALIVVNSWKGEMNTVRSQRGAVNYVKNGSFRVTKERDIFLYRKVTKIARDTDNNRSSGGRRGGGSTVHRSSGGRSGRF